MLVLANKEERQLRIRRKAFVKSNFIELEKWAWPDDDTYYFKVVILIYALHILFDIISK